MLDYTFHGKAGRPTLVFLHGWPDDERLWDAQVAHFSSRFTCVTVRLPRFGGRRGEGGPDFPELVQRLHATIATISRRPVTLVGHDWGAFLAYLYEHRYPKKVERLITLDVGPRLGIPTPLQALSIVSYQWYLVTAWALGRAAPGLGDRLSRGFARLAGAPRPGLARHDLNYPYVHFWRRVLQPGASSPIPKDYEPRCPILFLYGEKKPIHFHDPKWAEGLHQRPGCEAVGIAGAGHWFLVEKPGRTNQVMDRWLEATRARTGRRAA